MTHKPGLSPLPAHDGIAPETLPLAANLRQMIAVLEKERQSLATLDADGLFETAREKEALCDSLSVIPSDALDAQTRPLVETAQRLNDINRRVRNMLAANVASRLEALGAPRAVYQAARFATPHTPQGFGAGAGVGTGTGTGTATGTSICTGAGTGARGLGMIS